MVGSSRFRLAAIQILLKPGKHFTDLLGFAQVGHGVGQGVAVFEPEQRGELVGVQFVDAALDVVREDEVEEDLLAGVEVTYDVEAGAVSARLAHLLDHLEGQHHPAHFAGFAVPHQFHFSLLIEQQKTVFFQKWLNSGQQARNFVQFGFVA